MAYFLSHCGFYHAFYDGGSGVTFPIPSLTPSPLLQRYLIRVDNILFADGPRTSISLWTPKLQNVPYIRARSHHAQEMREHLEVKSQYLQRDGVPVRRGLGQGKRRAARKKVQTGSRFCLCSPPPRAGVPYDLTILPTSPDPENHT